MWETISAVTMGWARTRNWKPPMQSHELKFSPRTSCRVLITVIPTSLLQIEEVQHDAIFLGFFSGSHHFLLLKQPPQKMSLYNFDLPPSFVLRPSGSKLLCSSILGSMLAGPKLSSGSWQHQRRWSSRPTRASMSGESRSSACRTSWCP